MIWMASNDLYRPPNYPDQYECLISSSTLMEVPFWRKQYYLWILLFVVLVSNCTKVDRIRKLEIWRRLSSEIQAWERQIPFFREYWALDFVGWNVLFQRSLILKIFIIRIINNFSNLFYVSFFKVSQPLILKTRMKALGLMLLVTAHVASAFFFFAIVIDSDVPVTWTLVIHLSMKF